MDDEQKRQLLIGGGVLAAGGLAAWLMHRRANEEVTRSAVAAGLAAGRGVRPRISTRVIRTASERPLDTTPDAVIGLYNAVKQYDQSYAARSIGTPLVVSGEISQALRDRIRTTLIDIHNRITNQPTRGSDPLFGRRDLWPPQGLYPVPRTVGAVRNANEIDAAKLTRYLEQVMQVGARSRA